MLTLTVELLLFVSKYILDMRKSIHDGYVVEPIAHPVYA